MTHALRQPRPPRRRGYILLELVTVVALLGLFTIIIGSTFAAAYRGQVNAERRDHRDHLVDAAMAMLRRDTWNAARFDPAPDGLILTDTAGNTTTWTWGQTWTRTLRPAGVADPSSTMHFTGLPTENIHVDIHRPTLLLHFGGKTLPPESIAFFSQVAPGATP